ncbi:MAG: serine/threonine protein phosphatase, partial [Sulfurospirillum sp.]
IAFLKALRPYYLDKKNGYLFVHAGIDPESKDLERQVKKGTVYWIRDKFILSKKRLPYKVVFGHTPFFEPFVKKDKIGLDCGIYRTGYINLMRIDGRNFEIFKL